MNIALLHYSAPPVVGGVESVMAHQARCIADAGHDVRILAARGERFDPRIPFVGVPLADSRHGRVLDAKRDLDAGIVPPDFDALRDALAYELGAALNGADVLIAHNVCSLNKNLALTASLYELFCRSRALRSRLILWHHDLAWTTPRYRAELHDGYPWDLLRMAWPGATQVTISELRREELAQLMSIPPAAVRVVPNGIDVERFFKLDALTRPLLEATGALQSDLILLLPVRVTPRKNIELALRTVAALRASYRNPMLIVTGPLGPHNPSNIEYFERLRALRDELSLAGAAHFLAELSEGFLPDEVIADFYRLADALFLPSREEGFGLPMLEAALSHLPVFCSDIAPLRALGDRDATYFSPDDPPERVAERITERMAADPAYRSAARARATFTWPAVYRQHIEPLLHSHE